MLLLKLAFKNLIGAGVRSWLNIFVLSVSFVVIIWTQGLYNGIWNHSKQLLLSYDVAGGQYWHSGYDTYDVLNINDAYSEVPSQLNEQISLNKAEPILIRQGSIYPAGRMQPVLMKGIDPNQQVSKMPTYLLAESEHPFPILIGKRMAKETKLKKNDTVMIRWRNAKGGFDAAEAKVLDIMMMDVPAIDSGQIWLSYNLLAQMMELSNHATIITLAKDSTPLNLDSNWIYKSQDDLLIDLKTWMSQEKGSAFILYLILMSLAIIGIFDSQIFSLFKRRKEIGTLMALGMTRKKVVQLFTVEGLYNAILASVVGAIYGIPICYWTLKNGINLGDQMENYNFAVSSIIYPVYSVIIIGSTTAIIFLTVTFFSYLPLKRLHKLKPTDALRGKWS